MKPKSSVGSSSPVSWPGDPTGRTASVRGADPPAHELTRLAGAGFRRARTGALTPRSANLLLAEGWEVVGRLRLLEHGLDQLPRPPGPRPRRGYHRHLPAVNDVDRAAFPAEWQLGPSGIEHALMATPIRRLRIHRPAGTVSAFAVSGVSGATGYLQRLAVSGEVRRTGIGRRLTVDSLSWMRRKGARKAVVNTYEGNEPAVELYRSVGFVEQAAGLVVLSIDL